MGINDFAIGGNAYETAAWYYEDRKFKYIKVEQASQTEKQFRLLIQNLITDATSTVLKTRYPNDYKINDKIYFREKYWVIRNIGVTSTEVAPQALGLIKPDTQQSYILEIYEADKTTVYYATENRDI